MSAKIRQYLNDVVSLSVILLMAMALIAGRAGAGADANASHDTSSLALTSHAEASSLIESGSAELTHRLDLMLGDVAESLPMQETTEAIGDVVVKISIRGK
jgi:hypothetical protein